MIEVTELTKQYGNILAVDRLSFSVPDKSVVGLLGPNGAGKTTTMRMLTTFIAPSSGTAVVAGFDVRREAAKVRAAIGYLPETPPLYPELRIEEYLRFVARIKGVASKRVASVVDEAIEQCILSDVRRQLCSQVSKGFRQRIGLAGAILHKPKVIILDEPTSGLDPAQIIEIRQVIRNLGSEHTVILSTHILPEVSETCSSVIIIAKGGLVAEGTVAELTSSQSLEERFLAAVSATKTITKRETADSEVVDA